MEKLNDWSDILKLIPKKFRKSNTLKRSGIAGIFSASLELTKDGVIDLMQDNLFDDVLIRSAKHTPLKLRNK